jgi:lipopolysaccharide transport system ATP-binding protein
MSNIVIRAENLGKKYIIGHETRNPNATFRDAIVNRTRQIAVKTRQILHGGQLIAGTELEEFWALKDINFEVEKGESVGIIGRNGAGKSTLLKILSRITEPTTGTVALKGRVASLLEVGTGFHQELSGRENIYLNGAILGMSRKEITRKFDEIVDFSGIEKFLDTPVKRYSSGMYVRLAFAVAAHLESEILIVDEVLAVGDAEFQKKAVGRMQDVSQNEGRTVLFVSHNMQAISTLTSKSILIQNGLKINEGQTDSIISYYLSQNSFNIKYLSESKNESQPYIRRIEVFTSMNSNVHEHGNMLKIEFEIFTPFPISSAALSYQIFNSNGQAVLHILNLDDEIPFCRQEGIYRLISIIHNCKLYPDTYSITAHFADKITKNKFETIKDICNFEVKVFNELRDYYWYPKHAVYIEDNEWIVEKIK